MEIDTIAFGISSFGIIRFLIFATLSYYCIIFLQNRNEKVKERSDDSMLSQQLNANVIGSGGNLTV